jgi:hypothetical protein
MEKQAILSQLEKLDIPQHFTREDVAVAAKDAELLHRRIISNPDDFTELLNSITGGDSKKCQGLVRSLRLTEQDFKDDGGGIVWLVVVAVLLYSTEAH